VTDATVQQFLMWLETRSHCPRPRDVTRRIPVLWNEARTTISEWPNSILSRLSFKAPQKRLAWNGFNAEFRRDVEDYLAKRADIDIFDELTTRPRRPLAPSTIKLHREQLRLAASILVNDGIEVGTINSLADVVQIERFKIILRHYHGRRKGEPSAFAIGIANTLVQVAQYHVMTSADHIAHLKRLAAKLPPIPFDLTQKNKSLLRQLESERMRAKLLFLPEELLSEVARAGEAPVVPVVKAQVAIAIDVLLAAPLRPQNLSGLHWARHLIEPDGGALAALHPRPGD
jgi:hypothetical protein